MPKKIPELLADDKKRCDWCNQSRLYQSYHDNEWGIPLHDEKRHFELLLLETMQAGLSWYTILQRREFFSEAFAGFDAKKIAQFEHIDIERLMNNPGIIRNRAKINAAINNARLFLDIQDEFGSYDNYIWGFTDNQVIVNNWQTLAEVPTKTKLSDEITLDLKKRGFLFVGSTTIYAYLQAIGIVNDHLASCWRKQV